MVAGDDIISNISTETKTRKQGPGLELLDKQRLRPHHSRASQVFLVDSANHSFGIWNIETQNPKTLAKITILNEKTQIFLFLFLFQVFTIQNPNSSRVTVKEKGKKKEKE